MIPFECVLYVVLILTIPVYTCMSVCFCVIFITSMRERCYCSFSNWGKVTWFARNYGAVKWHWQEMNPELADFIACFLITLLTLSKNTHCDVHLQAVWTTASVCGRTWKPVEQLCSYPEWIGRFEKFGGALSYGRQYSKAVEYKKAPASLHRTEHSLMIFLTHTWLDFHHQSVH